MSGSPREFIKRYHYALVKGAGDRLENLKSRIGSTWAEDFQRKSGSIDEMRDFAAAYEDFLRQELNFCEDVKVEGSDGELMVDIKGCHICFGNDELRKEGSPTMCPLIPTGLFSLRRVAGKNASLARVDKPGPVGECRIVYQVKDGRS